MNNQASLSREQSTGLQHAEFSRQLSYYKKLYSLPMITNHVRIGHSAYRQVLNKNIVLVVLSNERKEVFYQNSNGLRSKEIIGGYARKSNIESSVVDVVIRESGVLIDELRPLCLVKNVLRHDDQTAIQYGVAFLAFVRHVNCIPAELSGEFMKMVPENLIQLDREIVDLGRKSIDGDPFNPTFEEIDEARQLGWRYILHALVIQRLGRATSSVKVRRFISSCLLGESILDVSCGDDDYAVEIARNNRSKVVVANDIAWASVEKLIRSATSENIVFTNHDILTLPYRSKFDTVLFKNTMHHFHQCQLQTVFDRLLAISKQRLIVVDIEDPFLGSFSHRTWARYYRSFLKDKGKKFFSEPEFRSTITTYCQKNSSKIGFSNVRTTRGNYMVAVIDKKR